MPIVMLFDTKGSCNEYGSETRIYKKGETLSTETPWQQNLAKIFLDGGMAEETKVVEPMEKKVKQRSRARNADGTLKGDDPSTPNINEAWETK